MERNDAAAQLRRLEAQIALGTVRDGAQLLRVLGDGLVVDLVPRPDPRRGRASATVSVLWAWYSWQTNESNRRRTMRKACVLVALMLMLGCKGKKSDPDSEVRAKYAAKIAKAACACNNRECQKGQYDSLKAFKATAARFEVDKVASKRIAKDLWRAQVCLSPKAAVRNCETQACAEEHWVMRASTISNGACACNSNWECVKKWHSQQRAFDGVSHVVNSNRGTDAAHSWSVYSLNDPG